MNKIKTLAKHLFFSKFMACMVACVIATTICCIIFPGSDLGEVYDSCFMAIILSAVLDLHEEKKDNA